MQTTGLSTQGSKGWLFVERNPARAYFDLMHAKENHFSPEMVDYLVHHFAALTASQFPLIGPGCQSYHLCLFLRTEYKRAGVIFRGHGNYRRTGPWYDWVMLRWAREDNQRYAEDADCQAHYGDSEATAMEHLYAPGRIMGFVIPMPVDWNSEAKTPITGAVMAVVSTCNFSHSRGSEFSTQWQQSHVYHAGNRKAPNLQLVDVNAIVRHCLMVPHEVRESSYHEIWSQELWGNEFNDCS
jgi:hypothetical protein